MLWLIRSRLGTNVNRFLRGTGGCVSLRGGGRKPGPARKFSSSPIQKAERRDLAFRLFLPNIFPSRVLAQRASLARAHRLRRRPEPAMHIRLLAFDDPEEFALDLLRDRTPAPRADSNAVDRAHRRDLRRSAAEEHLIGD